MYKSPEEVLKYIEMPEPASKVIEQLMIEIENLKSETKDFPNILENATIRLDTIIRENPNNGIIDKLKSVSDYMYSAI
jgi:hypothetical protein